MKKYFLTALLFATIILQKANAQQQDTTDIFKETEVAEKQPTEIVQSTFKASRIVNSHSVETTKAGILDFRINHRFGFINSGSYELFGLDNATERMSFDLGLTSRLAIGIGRSTYLKQYDGFIKYRLLHQTTGQKQIPISIAIVAATAIKTIKNTDPTKPYTTADKTSYTLQAIIAKKFNSKTSIQLMPTMVHYNLVPTTNNPNDMFSLGIAARQKINHKLALTTEYYHQFNTFSGYQSSLALGLDIETGGHIFQLHLTNSTGMTEPTFIHQTTGNFFDGDIHFGFNISRAFNVKRHKETRTKIR